MSRKMVYYFGGGEAEGKADMKFLLGGKGANLAEMTNIGLPVPPGITITTKVCKEYFKNNCQFPEGMWEQVLEGLARIEKEMGKKFGDKENPLLVFRKVRSSCFNAGNDGHNSQSRT